MHSITIGSCIAYQLCPDLTVVNFVVNICNKFFSVFGGFLINCIHRIASGGYYGFCFVTPPPPPQCVERFHSYQYNEKNIKASLLKFTGYIHNHKMMPGNIFGLILKNKMATTCVFSTSARIFAGPLVIICLQSSSLFAISPPDVQNYQYLPLF